MKPEFKLQQQEQSNWCWAAIVASIRERFRPEEPITQSELANIVFERDDCNIDGASIHCNRPYALQKALELVDHLMEALLTPITFDDVVREIDNNRPVIVALKPPIYFIGHYVMIVNIELDGKLKVLDPRKPNKPILVGYRQLRDGFENGHTWVNTYLVRP